MKKILILGAGNAQIDLIEYCNENNYEVYNFFKEVLPLSFTKNNLK